MSDLNAILAESDPAVRIIIGALVVFFWIVSGIISALAKKKEAERREQVRRQVERSVPRQVQAPPPLPSQRPVVQKRQPRPKQQQARSAPQVPFAQAAPVAVKVPDPITAVPTAHRKTSVAAVALHGWLRPATLRQQFILTEVLQPPIALREPRD